MSPPPTNRALAAALRSFARRASVVLLYHGIGTARPEHDPFNLLVAPEMFRRQVELLSRAGFEFTTVSGLAQTIEAGKPRPGLAALSFDDGMADNRSVVEPILTQIGARATVYVLTGSMGEPNPFMDPASGERMMTPAEVGELAAAGFEIGAHTVTHPDMSALGYASCLDEAERSRDTLAELLGEAPVTFAYPFGHYGEAAIRAVRDAGFETAVTCVNRGSWEPFEMKRRLITGKDGLPGFTARVLGVYEPVVLGPAGSAARRLRAGLRGLRATGSR